MLKRYFLADHSLIFLFLDLGENIPREKERDMEIIKHFTHQHELSLSREKKRKYPEACEVCNEYCDEGVMIYSCRESDCRFTLHESCAKLPQELHNPLLHPHPLSLKLPEHMFLDFKCNGCGNISLGSSFHCDKCDVNLDVKCGFIRPAMEEGEEAVVVGTHFSHRQHPWVPLENIPASHIRCIVCGKYCSDPKTYGCLQCGFFLHPSCLNLPEEIFHPFHPYHRLTLKPIKDIDHYHPRTPKRIKDDDDDDVKCNACRRDIYGDEYFGCFAYFCKCCNNTKTSFCLDAECASVIMPAITYEGHDHLLVLFLDIDRKVDELIKNCSACKSSTCESYGFRCLDLHFDDNIGDERIKCSACKSTCESYAFSCLDQHCDFNLHLSCGPLPYTIQHKSHIHPLILTICPIEDEKDCEPDEFYCNVCEKERDPFLPIYYCKECPFVAGISCVISEVVSLLKGEHGDVELRNPFGQFGNLIREKQQLVTKPALTLFGIFNSLSEGEKAELNCNLEIATSCLGNMEWKASTSENPWAEINLKVDKAYTKFMEFVDIGIEIPIEFRDTKEDVQISDFKFCYKLLPEEEVVDLEDYQITRKLAPILKGLLSKYEDARYAPFISSPKVRLYFLHMLCECIYSMINTKVVDITTNDLLNWWTILEISKWVEFRIQFVSDHLKRVALAHFGLSAEKQGSNVLDQLATDIEALKRKLERLTSIKSILIKKCAEASMLKGWKAGVGLLKAGVGLL